MHRLKCYKHGHASMEKLFPSGMYIVQLYIGQDLRDKVRCDDYTMALEYYRAFSRIAKNGGRA